MQTKAVMPSPEQASTRSTHGVKPAWPAKASSHLKMAEAKLTNLRSKPAAEHDEQQWIVFTSWEQVETSSASQGQMADYDTAQDSGATTNSQPHQASRFTVTRLILKVLPPSSNSPQLGAMPLRDGWLVIQL
jgi:hypothetical protein